MLEKLTTIFLKLPLAIVQRTNLTRLEPTRDAVEMKCLGKEYVFTRSTTAPIVSYVIADTPSHRAFFGGGRRLIRLTLDTQVHDVIATDSAIIDDDVPSPQGDGIPFLHFEAFLLSNRGVGC